MVSYAELSNFQSYYMEVWEKGFKFDLELRDDITRELLSVDTIVQRYEPHLAKVGINLYCGNFTEAALLSYIDANPEWVFPPGTDGLVSRTMGLPLHVMEDSGFTAHRRWEGIFKVTNRQFWSMTCATAPSIGEAEAIRLIGDMVDNMVDMPPPYMLPEFIQASAMEIDMLRAFIQGSRHGAPSIYAVAAQHEYDGGDDTTRAPDSDDGRG
jgi:hypothetical protein